MRSDAFNPRPWVAGRRRAEPLSVAHCRRPAVPTRFCREHELPTGPYQIVRVGAHAWSIERRSAAGAWYPLTGPGARTWRTWPTLMACRLDCFGSTSARGFGFASWAYWGAL